MSKYHILVADDDVQMVEIAKIILENAGYYVTHTYDSEEVVEIAKREKPDLIILDVLFAAMDGKAADGFEITRLIKSNSDLKDIPVIILSGVNRIRKDGYKFEVNDEFIPAETLLEKPVKPGTLLKEVRKLLNREVTV